MFHVFSCLLGFIMIYPLLWLVASSFKSNDTMFKNTYSLFASTAGYSFGHFFMNSAIVTVHYSSSFLRIMRFLLHNYANTAT